MIYRWERDNTTICRVVNGRLFSRFSPSWRLKLSAAAAPRTPLARYGGTERESAGLWSSPPRYVFDRQTVRALAPVYERPSTWVHSSLGKGARGTKPKDRGVRDQTHLASTFRVGFFLRTYTLFNFLIFIYTLELWWLNACLPLIQYWVHPDGQTIVSGWVIHSLSSASNRE